MAKELEGKISQFFNVITRLKEQNKKLKKVLDDNDKDETKLEDVIVKNKEYFRILYDLHHEILALMKRGPEKEKQVQAFDESDNLVSTMEQEITNKQREITREKETQLRQSKQSQNEMKIEREFLRYKLSSESIIRKLEGYKTKLQKPDSVTSTEAKTMRTNSKDWSEENAKKQSSIEDKMIETGLNDDVKFQSMDEYTMKINELTDEIKEITVSIVQTEEDSILHTSAHNTSHSTVDLQNLPAASRYIDSKTLPKFTGNVLDYTDFKREFKSRVESMILDDDARASYLKSEHVIPVDAIRNLLKQMSYSDMWSTLDERYDDKRSIAAKVEQDMTKWKAVYNVNKQEFVNLVEKADQTF